ncbi:testican-1-like [Glandiceps talaboti]
MKFSIAVCVFVILVVFDGARAGQKKNTAKWQSLVRPVSDSESLYKTQWKQLQTDTVEKKMKDYDPCEDVKCGHSKVCLVLEDNTAICISKTAMKQNHKLHSKLVKEKAKKGCSKCPIVHPYFVCGTDGKTYNDECHLERKVCMTGKKVTKGCDGRCPCKVDEDVVNLDDDIVYTQDYPEVDETPEIPKQILTMTDVLPNINEPLVDPRPRQDVAELTFECTADELVDLPRRLIEWFSLMKEDEDELYKKNPHKVRPKASIEVLPKCKESTAWMFTNMDDNRDLILTMREMKRLYDDEYELCMVPFLDSCDQNTDQKISSHEWCDCFHQDDDQPPCITAMRQVPSMVIMGAVKPLPGAFIPACDEMGFFAGVQCHSSTGYCWCVDKYGTEYENTRVHGEPPCDEIIDDTETDDGIEEGSGF